MAHEAGNRAKESAHEAADQVKATARQTGERVKQQAAEAANTAKEQGRTILNEQKTRVASEVRAYSQAARRAADRLEAESDTNLSHYVASAADHLDQLGNRIDERNLGELVDDVEGLARKRPELFYGGMFVAGMAVARFLKASKRKRQRSRYPSGSYQRGTDGRPSGYPTSTSRNAGLQPHPNPPATPVPPVVLPTAGGTSGSATMDPQPGYTGTGAATPSAGGTI